MTFKGYVIEEKDKDNYYRGSVMGHKFSGFYGAKIYKSHKLALKALESVKVYIERCSRLKTKHFSMLAFYKFSIYEVEATIKDIENNEVVE